MILELLKDPSSSEAKNEGDDETSAEMQGNTSTPKDCCKGSFNCYLSSDFTALKTLWQVAKKRKRETVLET